MSSNGTISKALDSLEYLELIKRHEHRSDNGWTNNYYTFFPPIENRTEFERKFNGELRKE